MRLHGGFLQARSHIYLPRDSHLVLYIPYKLVAVFNFSNTYWEESILLSYNPVEGAT